MKPLSTAAYQESKQSVVDHLLQHYQESVVAEEGRLSIHALLREAKYVDGSILLPIGKLTMDHAISILSAVISKEPTSIRAKNNEGKTYQFMSHADQDFRWL